MRRGRLWGVIAALLVGLSSGAYGAMARGGAARLFSQPTDIFGVSTRSEASIFQDGPRVHMILRTAYESPIKILHYYADDSAASVWQGGAEITGISTYKGFPTATPRQPDGYFYLLVNNSDAGPGAAIYMYRSTDADNWMICNGGNPVLTTDSSPSSRWYRIFNTAQPVIMGSEWHLFVEAATDPSADPIGWGISYTHGTLSGDSIDFDSGKSASNVVIPLGACPCTIRVPNRHAVIMLASWFPLDGRLDRNGNSSLVLLGYYAADTADLSDPQSWTRGEFTVDDITDAAHRKSIADSDLAVLTGKDHTLVLAFNRDQLNMYSTYADVTIDQFYDALVSPAAKTTFSGVTLSGCSVH